MLLSFSAPAQPHSVCRCLLFLRSFVGGHTQSLGEGSRLHGDILLQPHRQEKRGLAQAVGPSQNTNITNYFCRWPCSSFGGYQFQGVQRVSGHAPQNVRTSCSNAGRPTFRVLEGGFFQSGSSQTVTELFFSSWTFEMATSFQDLVVVQEIVCSCSFSSPRFCSMLAIWAFCLSIFWFASLRACCRSLHFERNSWIPQCCSAVGLKPSSCLAAPLPCPPLTSSLFECSLESLPSSGLQSRNREASQLRLCVDSFLFLNVSFQANHQLKMVDTSQRGLMIFVMTSAQLPAYLQVRCLRHFASACGRP